MTPTQIILVKDSFRKVMPIADAAASLFYARLFELDPTLRPMFRGDMVSQGKKLMSVLGMTVAMLHRMEMILPQVREMGVRHAEYGVAERHYATVGEALLWTLEKGLGPEFTPEVREAWVSTYSLIATTMIAAADEARSNAPVGV
jgi:hemoglobin-like flavoprotein